MVYNQPYSALSPLPTPTARTGYTFAGWYTAWKGGTKVTDSTVFSDRDAIINNKTVTLYAHWNKWDSGVVTRKATCTRTGLKTYTCSLTGEKKKEVIPAYGHNWDNGVVTTAPTCTSTGVRTYTCSRCGLTETESIAKLPKKNQSDIFIPAAVTVGKTNTINIKTAVGTVTCTSSNPKVATVTNTGVIRGISHGEVTITVKASGNDSYNAATWSRKVYSFKCATPKISKVVRANGGLTISWDKIAGATLYRLYYKTSTQGWTKIVDTSTLSYTWKGPKSGVYYTLMIRCVDKNGKSMSNCYPEGYQKLYLAAPTPSGLKNNAAGQLSLTWAKVAGAEGYKIQYSADKTFKTGVTTLSAPGKATSITIKSLKKGCTYYVRMFDYKGTGANQLCSAWGTVKSIKIVK